MSMEYIPVTSFRRPIDAVRLKHVKQVQTPPAMTVSKWDALRRLAIARQHYGLSDRDLAVLQALLGFHPETELGADSPPAIVYPSNKAICERLNGMPCSTMRRHIAHLVDTGVILRRDSPNGKRYVRRGGGGPKLAFGFDLAPLATRYAEFDHIARRLEEAEAHRKRLRETVSLMRRDLAAFADYGDAKMPGFSAWDRLSDLARLTARDLRRKLTVEVLTDLEDRMRIALAEVSALLDAPFSVEMGTSDAENEHHHQSSDKEYGDMEDGNVGSPVVSTARTEQQPPPLRLVLDTCGEIQGFSEGAVRTWADMIRLSDIVSPMMGITSTVWRKCQSQLGLAQAATVLAAMLERFGEIRSPSGYLRFLCQKAEIGAFSCGPMIRALESRRI